MLAKTSAFDLFAVTYGERNARIMRKRLIRWHEGRILELEINQEWQARNLPNNS